MTATTENSVYSSRKAVADTIMTVLGRIDAAHFGRCLPHEHIMVDFVGADQTGPHRWDVHDVIEKMHPYLAAAAQRGIRGLVECTPAYLGRDVTILTALAQRTGMNIVTNTGWYKEPFLPARAFTLSAEAIAAEWTAEFADGIATGVSADGERGERGERVRPGFIKTAVESGPLAPMQQKIIQAAALTSRATGLAIGTHTGFALPALQILAILDKHAVDADRWIFIHAQNEPDQRLVELVAKRGAWIELDGIGYDRDIDHATRLLKLLDAGFEDRIMISHDAGWYRVGEPDGGAQKPFTTISDGFLPFLASLGLSQSVIDRLMIDNPARAFALRSA